MPVTADTLLDYDGIEQPIGEWALDYGIAPIDIVARLAMGWTAERAITEPIEVASRDSLKARRRREGLTFGGKSLPFATWSKLTGIPATTLRYRASRSWPIERILKPREKQFAHNSRLLTHGGRTMSVTAWAEAIGMSQSGLNNRLNKGWPVERALTTPPLPRELRHAFRQKALSSVACQGLLTRSEQSGQTSADEM